MTQPSRHAQRSIGDRRRRKGTKSELSRQTNLSLFADNRNRLPDLKQHLISKVTIHVHCRLGICARCSSLTTKGRTTTQTEFNHSVGNVQATSKRLHARCPGDTHYGLQTLKQPNLAQTTLIDTFIPSPMLHFDKANRRILQVRSVALLRPGRQQQDLECRVFVGR